MSKNIYFLKTYWSVWLFSKAEIRSLNCKFSKIILSNSDSNSRSKWFTLVLLFVEDEVVRFFESRWWRCWKLDMILSDCLRLLNLLVNYDFHEIFSNNKTIVAFFLYSYQDVNKCSLKLTVLPDVTLQKFPKWYWKKPLAALFLRCNEISPW